MPQLVMNFDGVTYRTNTVTPASDPSIGLETVYEVGQPRIREHVLTLVWIQ
jgi:hypothetical protein